MYIFSGPFILSYAEEHYRTGKIVRIRKIYICPISINISVDYTQKSYEAAGAYH